MADDIVKRAKRHAKDVLDPGYPYYGTPELVREMAAEIERLRLTDAERKAISRIYDLLNERSRELQAARRIEESTPYVQLAKTLQTMWERVK